jgi:S-adenosylmethionine decarboxylase
MNNASLSLASLEQLSWDANTNINTIEPPIINDEVVSGSGSTSGGSTSDEQSGNDTYYTGCFEGPEKTMEVVFRSDKGPEEGLRTLTRTQLDFLCTKAKCSIVHHISNQHMDAYVLSESSLFVYKHRFIMKTCGTTTLLRCLSSLLEFADAMGMEFTWVGYSRKNLLFPTQQLWPHSNFGDEIRYIQTHDKLQNRLQGTGYILGPITGDHWFVYVADHSETSPLFKRTPLYIAPPPSNERTLNMMMFDMAPEVASVFYQANTPSGKEMTLKSGINHLCPGALIDEMAFTPCGYSMNAILHDAYSTIHITPEPQCSYASFETNTMLENYQPMVRNTLSVFRPQRFVLTMFGDQMALDSLKAGLPTDQAVIALPKHGLFYARTSVSSTKVDVELCCLMACYSLVPVAVTPLRTVTPAAVADRVSPPLVGIPKVSSQTALADQSFAMAGLASALARERAYSF